MQIIGWLIVKLDTNKSTLHFDAFEKLTFITKHKADCKVSYSKQILPFQLVCLRGPSIHIYKGNKSFWSVTLQPGEC